MKKLLSLAFCGLIFNGLCALPAAADVPPGLRPSPPILCDGNEDMTVRGRYITGGPNGVEARTNCEIVIVNSHIEVAGIGVLALGNSEIRVINSFVSGSRGALVAEGNSEIRYRDSTIHGGIFARGNAETIDKGNNKTDRAMKSPSPAPMDQVSVKSGPGGVRVDADGTSVTVDADRVRVESSEGVTEIAGDWRTFASAYSTADMTHLLKELGAVEAAGVVSLNLAGDVLFDFNSSAIRPDAAAELAKVAYVIRQRAVGTITVVVQTDAIVGGIDNQRLSEARAAAVKSWLNVHERVPARLIEASGMGERKPIAHNTRPDGSDDPAGRAQNRRVEIRFAIEE
jgi:outer membrane protein OmpA-like peptidoglycan-associated protein